VCVGTNTDLRAVCVPAVDHFAVPKVGKVLPAFVDEFPELETFSVAPSFMAGSFQ
jgi:hypothetical protein